MSIFQTMKNHSVTELEAVYKWFSPEQWSEMTKAIESSRKLDKQKKLEILSKFPVIPQKEEESV